MRRVLLLLALVVATLAAPPTHAQEPASERITVTLPADLDPAVRAEVLRALGDAGAEAVEPAPAAQEDWQQRYADEVDTAVDGALAMGGRLASWWQRAGGASGFALIVLCLLAGLAAAALVERALGACTRRGDAALPRFRRRLAHASWAFLRDAVAIAAFLVVSFALGLALLPDESPAPWLTLSGFANHIFVALLVIALARLIANPVDRAARLAPLADDEARRVWRVVLAVIVILAPLACFRALVVNLAAAEWEATLAIIALEAIVTAARIWLFWSLRAPIRGLIEHSFGNGRGAPQPPMIGWFAQHWHRVYVALALLRLAAVVLGRLEGADIGDAVDYAFTALLLLPFALGGIGAWFDDRGAAGEGAGVAGGAKALAQGTVAFAGLVFALRAWGIDPFAAATGGIEDRVSAALLEAGLALVVGWAIWRAVRIVLDRYAPEGAQADLESEGFGKAGSRLDTLVPLLRSTALVVIATIAILTALGALGVNITALLAGAGVIGLAVGFGAQTLVKDVITGIFYLIEDAFRVGEYLVTAEGKGVVEKISLRSVRLRHHRGPVYTIPFGSMGTVQNHSRDWVKIKLLLRVPFNTDLEKVRRLIKKVGVEMQNQPEIAPHLIQPVKSQGVLEVDDSAMIIGVKFICKPGEQFVIRREAYARIQKAFAENGIEFAPRRVIVESDTPELARARAGAAAAAAAHSAEIAGDAAR
ncbi:MAG: mechanosensitive ion channel domain-containing protein [Alphaproteobacteria bacterium]